MKWAGEMFVRFDCRGRLMLQGRGLIRGLGLGNRRRWSVRRGSGVGERVD